MSALTVQLDEVEMLQSMFSPSELRLEEQVSQSLKNRPEEDYSASPISFTLNLELELKMEISVTLPADYPVVEPEIFVRSECLDKRQQSLLNKELEEFIKSQERGEMCIYSAVSWLQENAARFNKNVAVEKSTKRSTEDKLARLWIYSHHIYNKNKRRNILSFAAENKCTGFMLPGKPGIICIEGIEGDCEDMWQQIRNMNWKKIMLKVKEEVTRQDFTTFEEASFHKCKDERHMDMGEFFKYLESFNCGYIFKEYFGVDGKVPTEM